MAVVLVAVKGAKTLLGETEPSIDNWTFRLFYKVGIGWVRSAWTYIYIN